MRKYFITICFIVLLLPILLLNGCGNKKKLVLTISLLYEQASNGLSPDGTRYNPYDILSDNILETVSIDTGVPLQYLKNNLQIEYDGAKDRITTDYKVVYNGEEGNVQSILSSVGDAYVAYMQNTYAYKTAALEVADGEEKDLLEQLDDVSALANAGYKYLSELSGDSGRYSNDKQLFNYIATTAIPTYRNLIIQNGVSYDTERLTNYLDYQNRLLERKRLESQGQYQNRIDAIALYDATLFPTTSVPSVLNGEYYISTTKTGLDDIYLDAKYFMDDSLALQASITENEYIKQQLTGNEPSQDILQERNILLTQLQTALRNGAQDIITENERQQNVVVYRIDIES